VRKFHKTATPEDIKSLLCSFYEFMIATGNEPKPIDGDLLKNFNATDEPNSVLFSCDIIETSDCSRALKNSANYIKSMFIPK
jgi:hypothetical protein